MERTDKLLSGLNLSGLGLEVGPGCHPLIAGNPQYNVRSLDHADREGLIAKYAALGENVAGVPHIDYIWKGQRYKNLVGAERFDYIIASHVIEHIPDLIGFIESCAEILKDDGVLSLAIPDRRFTFDYYRPRASLARVVDCHLQGKTKPSPGDTIEHIFSMANYENGQSWGEPPSGSPYFIHSADYARSEFEKVREGAFIDMHVWIFTPWSFRWLIEDLRTLDLITLRERDFSDIEDYEFFAQLSRQGTGPGIPRQNMAAKAIAES
jgi:SAM-dependent methyltransferase